MCVRGMAEGCVVFMWDEFMQSFALMCVGRLVWEWERRRMCCAVRFGRALKLTDRPFLLCGVLWSRFAVFVMEGQDMCCEERVVDASLLVWERVLRDGSNILHVQGLRRRPKQHCVYCV